MIHWDHFKVLFKRQAGLNDVYADWETYPTHTVYSLLRSIASGADINAEFDALTPRTRLYTNLKKKIEDYKKLAMGGEWPTIPELPKIARGQSNPSIPLIRKRLSLSGDLKDCVVNDSLVYDQCLVDAVKRFQERNGQESDGVIGKETARLLRESIAQILTRMQLNLDRIKMMKRNDSGRHIMVNVPAFQLYFFEDGTVRQTMRTITGSKRHPTPIFSDTVEMIVLNPYWNVPTSIIQKEMIPKLLRNKNAMSREGIEVRNGWGSDAKKISPASIDWSQYRYSRSVPFRFAQVPGTRNALGKVKFLFPNKFSVYMHDTPTKHLFNRNTRAFSHGCIRLQKPRELLKTFSSFNANVDYEQSQKTLKGRKQTYLNLNEKVPVDVAYLTAWVDPSGTLQMRDDIYGYDKMQLKYQRHY
jgi:murein L,D-transpeptidase YcbB/YkuD